MEDIFDRTRLLVGDKGIDQLKKAKVLIAGLGGVGAYACEAIVRSGVENIIIFDGDTISPTNINRQILAMHSTINHNKADIMYSRIRDINPSCKIVSINEFVRDQKMEDILKDYKPDWIVDAIDTLSPKTYLLIMAYQLGIKTVSSMGSGGKLDPSLIQIADISKTYNCPLAHHIRKNLHKHDIYKGITAVFSPEKVIQNSWVEDFSQNKRTTIGTISYMPAIFGLNCASVVIRDILNS